MTACRNKARGAVVAALAGALTLGAAPVMALADGASLMANDAANLDGAEVTYKNGGKAFDTFVLTGERQGLVPELLDVKVGDDLVPELAPTDTTKREIGDAYYYYVEVDGKGGTSFYNPDNAVTYKTEEDGKSSVLAGNALYEMPSKVGTYAVVIGIWNGGGSWTYVTEADTFTIASNSLDGATLFEGDDVTDGTFAYTGENRCNMISVLTDSESKYAVRVAIDGVALPDDAYELTFIQGGKEVTTDSIKPGSYTVRVEGTDDKAYEGKSVELPFTYGKLDLTDADIATTIFTGGSDIAEDTSLIESINGVERTDMQEGALDRISVDFVSGPDGALNGGYGAYQFKISAVKDFAGDDSSNDWVTGEQTVTVYNADAEAQIKYDGKELDGKDFETDLSDLESNPYFDTSDIKVTYVIDGETKSLKASEFVKVFEDGEEVSADELRNPGTYTVVVDVNTKVDGYVIAGRASADVTVGYGSALTEDANAFLAIDGKNVDKAATVYYDGTDYAEGMEAKVIANGVELAQGTDYEVSVSKKGADGIYVDTDSIVDAGAYRVTFKALTFKFGSDSAVTFDVTVKPAEVKAAEVDYALFDGDDGFLPYTGEAITPTFTFYTDAAKKEAIEVPAEAFEVTYTVDGDATNKEVELKDEGEYVAHFSDALNTDNYSFSTTNVTANVIVADKKVFVDVPNNEYYTESVYTAVNEGYVEGMGGSNLFMPNSSMSRAQMVCVLYRMAGGDVQGEDWVASPYEETYLSQFSDVKGDEFFAQALAWAAKAGVVTGYEDGNFGPNDPVTVEQYVTMLARYAKAVGNYEAVDTDEVLGTVADGDKVSEFGQDAVAWAIESGYLAQGGADIQPQSPVTRGRAVTIAVRYQPEQADVVGKPADQ